MHIAFLIILREWGGVYKASAYHPPHICVPTPVYFYDPWICYNLEGALYMIINIKFMKNQWNSENI